jgi:hypothetical protein
MMWCSNEERVRSIDRGPPRDPRRPPQDYIDLVDGPQNIGQFSKDLAFELYYRVPEPTSAGMAMLALGSVSLKHRRGVCV